MKIKSEIMKINSTLLKRVLLPLENKMEEKKKMMVLLQAKIWILNLSSSSG
jgi:hypothetical protein